MYALVTGCAGFVGSHLTETLLAEGAEVIGVDCFNDNYGRRDKLRNLQRAMDWEGFEFVPIDLARGDLFDLVEGCDTVFHLAAEPGVRASWGTGSSSTCATTSMRLSSSWRRPPIPRAPASSTRPPRRSTVRPRRRQRRRT